MKIDKSKIIRRVVASYIALSVGAAFTIPLFTGSVKAPELLLSVPTVATLSGHGSIDDLWAYFAIMYSLLPIVIGILIYGYEDKELKLIEPHRRFGALLFFLAAMALLAWVAFFLPPDRMYRGTRIKIIIYLTSNSYFWLGLIYGIIFTCLALLVMLSVKYLSWFFIKNRTP